MTKPKIKSTSREDLKALMIEIGGEAKLRKILEDFYAAMAPDVLIGFFFDGKDLHHIAHQQANFLLNAAGLVDRFDGKGPSQAHLQMAPILSGHFDRRLVILRQVLEKHGLTSAQINAWVQFEEGFRLLVVKN